MSVDGRYTIRLDDDMIAEIDELRRLAGGDMPTRAKMIRLLVEESINVRKAAKKPRLGRPLPAPVLDD